MRRIVGKDFAVLRARVWEMCRSGRGRGTLALESALPDEVKRIVSRSQTLPRPDAERACTLGYLLRCSEAASVTDLGVGVGLTTAEIMRSGCQFLTAVERNPELVEQATPELELLARQLGVDFLFLCDSIEEALGNVTPVRGSDAFVLSEVIEEHTPDGARAIIEATLALKPHLILLSTPNRDFNRKVRHLADNGLRLSTHVYEWGRSEFIELCQDVIHSRDYSIDFLGVGPSDLLLGPLTQLAVIQAVG